MATFTNLASNVGKSPFSATLTNSINSAVRGGEAETLGANISQLGYLLRQFDADNLDGAGLESNTATKAKYFLSGNVIDPSSGYLQILGSNLPVYDPVSGSYGDPATNFRITSIEYRNSFLNNIRFIVAGTFSTTTTTITSIETGDDFLSVKVSGSISLDNIAGNVSSASLSNIAISFLDDDGIAVTATLGVSLSLTNKSLTVNSLAISKGSQSLFAAQNLGLLYSLDARDNPFSVGSVSANGLSRDLLFSANDIIVGTSGADSLDGYGGNDSINAGSGRDWIAGGVGNDTLLGAAGADTLSGGEGNDSLLGGTESDALYGDAGRDTLSGDAGNDFLSGGSDRDMLVGGVGSDTLAGGEAFVDRFGSYIIAASDSADTLDGGAGDDTYVIDNTGLVVVDSGGYDTGIVAIDGFVASVGGFAQIEKFVLYEDGVGRRFTANALNNVVIGGSGADTIDGGAGNDLLRGGEDSGGDSLFGGAGNDTLEGATAYYYAFDGSDSDLEVDTLSGGDGIDRFDVAYGTATITDLGKGGAEVLLVREYGFANATVAASWTATAATKNLGVANLSTNGFAVNLAAVTGGTNGFNVTNTGNATTLTGSGRSDMLIGGRGSDTLVGGNGDDALDGGAGNDSMNGGNGDDTLDGGSGNDLINGGTSIDVLTGGSDRDTFIFAAGDSGKTAGFDIITDLAKGAVGTGDLIDYSTNLTVGGNANTATSSQALINQTTGVASFASGSGKSLSDALSDIASRFTAATDAAGKFALFRVNGTGDFYLFISDGSASVTANDVVVQLTGISSVAGINLTGGNLTITS